MMNFLVNLFSLTVSFLSKQ